MPNLAQFTFLASFISTFVFLYLSTSYISFALRSRGWDINNLILLGLEKKDLGTESVPELHPLAAIWEVVKMDQTTQIALLTGLVTIGVLLLTKFWKPSKSGIE